MNEKIYNFLIKCIAITFVLLWLLIVFLNLFLNRIDYSNKMFFALPNIILLFVGMVIVFLLSQVMKNINMEKWKISIASCCLFIVQVYIFLNVYFNTNEWDPWTIYCNANMMADGQTEGLSDLYFSYFANNQCIVLVQAFLLKINKAFGVIDTDNGFMFLIIVQCIISSYAGKCVFDIIRKITNSGKTAWLGWEIYAILIGLSGWNIITYTDIFVIALPLIILKLYMSAKEKSCMILKWIAIISLSYWGFKIKPTVLIVFIAIVITEILLVVKNYRRENTFSLLKKAMVFLGIGTVLIVIYSSVFSAALNRSGLKIDRELDTGALHIMMMGLNPVNDGVWYADDVQLSMSISNKEERIEAQKEVIAQRMRDYGVWGFAKHIVRKSLIIFNDGTFAWGNEGGFYNVIYPDKNSFMAPALKSIYYNSGSRFIYFSTIMQMIWITVLFGAVGIVFHVKDSNGLVVVLSLIGIILFNYIFEARARYILVYVPFFIIAFAMSLHDFGILIKQKVK